MKNFVDDENTNYNEEYLIDFLNENNSYGFILPFLSWSYLSI